MKRNLWEGCRQSSVGNAKSFLFNTLKSLTKALSTAYSEGAEEDTQNLLSKRKS